LIVLFAKYNWSGMTVDEMGRACRTNGGDREKEGGRKSYKLLMGKTEGKRALGRGRCR
jgi:hypothetical protein